MKSYAISEIFGPTLQAEGMHAGWPCVFLRTSQCNLWKDGSAPSPICPFCDTPQLHNRTDMTVREIVQALENLRATAGDQRGYYKCGLVISGGEPLLQLDYHLMSEIAPMFPWVDIETNGTVVPLFPLDNPAYKNVHISCSPKTSKFIPYADWYKLLIPAKKHLLQQVLDVVASRHLEQPSPNRPQVPTRIYLQAVEQGGLESNETKAALKETIDTCIQYGIPLSFQSHKLLGLK